MELTSREWVGRGLEILARGLAPYVDRRMAVFWPGNKDWLQIMVGRARQDGRWPLLTRSDARLLLRVIDENPKAYLGSLSKLDLAYVREIREVANKWAHFEPFSASDVRRALDTIVRLLRAADATAEASEVAVLQAGLAPVRVSSDSQVHSDGPPATVLPGTYAAPGRTGQPVTGSRTVRAVLPAVEEFRKRDADYLAWLAVNHGGYVLNTGPQGGGNPVLHRATCATISRRPPFTEGYYIKVCSLSVAELDQWMQSRIGSAAQRCGLCHPPVATVADHSAKDSGQINSCRSNV